MRKWYIEEFTISISGKNNDNIHFLNLDAAVFHNINSITIDHSIFSTMQVLRVNHTNTMTNNYLKHTHHAQYRYDKALSSLRHVTAVSCAVNRTRQKKHLKHRQVTMAVVAKCACRSQSCTTTVAKPEVVLPRPVGCASVSRRDEKRVMLLVQTYLLWIFPNMLRRLIWAFLLAMMLIRIRSNSDQGLERKYCEGLGAYV